jgi:DNA-binding NtrC family response regulator
MDRQDGCLDSRPHAGVGPTDEGSFMASRPRFASVRAQVVQAAAVWANGEPKAARTEIFLLAARRMKHDPAGDTWNEESADEQRSLHPLRPHLFLILEADRPIAGGARYSLEGVAEVILGRGITRCVTRDESGGGRRLTVQMPGPWMSSAHARVVREGEDWIIEDLASKNGTFLGEERVTRARLAAGSIFDAGHAFFTLRTAVPTPKAAEHQVDGESLQGQPLGLRTLHPEGGHRLSAVERLARSTLPILILGETGTGKELLARAIHQLSGRPGRFVPVNCGALSAALVEGLLFGHVKGAFSGAVRDELGLVRSAAGGTLFLDEIGELPPAAQTALLRVLQEREVLPVGRSLGEPVDVRIVSATHRTLDKLVERDRFRYDLLTRIDGYRHPVLPLRARREDIGLVLADLLPRLIGARASATVFAPAAVRALLAYSWPGNVRELEHALARALSLGDGGRVERSGLSLPRQPGAAPPGQPAGRESEAETRETLRTRLLAELARHHGNVSEVARAMGKARAQVQRWMRRFGVDPEDFRRGH